MAHREINEFNSTCKSQSPNSPFRGRRVQEAHKYANEVRNVEVDCIGFVDE